MTVDLNFVFLLLALFSIALSIFAIWQALEHKKASEVSERAAQKALSEITSEMRFLREYAVPELKSYGREMRKFLFNADLRAFTSRAAQNGEASAPVPALLPTPTPETERNVRRDLVQAIKDIRKRDGKALAMTVFEALTEQYEFGVVLSEVLALRQMKKLRWDGDQEAPQAFDDLQLVGDI